MGGRLRSTLAVAVGALVAACAADGAGIDERCQGDRDCASGRCGAFYEGGANVCLQSCTDDVDCPPEKVCGTQADGARTCVSPCALPSDGYVCVDERPVACAQAGDAWDCFWCGCDAGEFCDERWQPQTLGGSCMRLRDAGQPCLDSDECASDNCSTLGGDGPQEAGVCWVAAGDRCTDQNCGSCDPTVAGPVCAQTCDRDADCVGLGRCVRDGGVLDPRFYCRPTCGLATPCANGWTCKAIANADFASCFPP